MDRHADAATLLLSAWRDPSQKLNAFPGVVAPTDVAQAYAVQRRVAEGLGPIGGWKVGAPGPDAPPSCAPMPAHFISPSPAHIHAAPNALRCVEAEIAFRMGADLPPRDEPYGRAEVIAAIACCVPAIEIVDSRFTHPDDMDKLSLLADSSSHGGFTYGPPAADWQGIDFAAETVRLVVDGVEIKTATANPAGDMIRLIQWLADTGTRWAGGLKAGQYVTCGSWTGKDYVGPQSHVQVTFAHAGTVAAEFFPAEHGADLPKDASS
jgi:2-keto-4-pentenoate hydratase